MIPNKILLVDDNTGQRVTLESILKRSGYSVVSADCGKAALEVFRKEKFAAALLDIKMPDITGIDVLKSIRKDEPDLTVIMMTGYAESEFAIDALNNGATSYILKPANIDHLKGLLNQAIDHMRLLEENRAMSVALREFNKHLEQKVQQRTKQVIDGHNLTMNLYQELKKNFEATLEVLAIAIDQRDPLTYSHSFRVTQYAQEIAKVMNLSEDDLEILRYAGLLHDLGKIEVKTEVLTKEGSLTSDEYKEIQKHAAGTFDLLSKFKFKSALRSVPLIASSHHERFDGGGYPRGLKGEEIPLHSRILGVADVLDAITSKRHYRTAMPIDNALGILKREAGGHFDPKCTEALFKVNLANFTKIHLIEFLSEVDSEKLIDLFPHNIEFLYEACQMTDPTPEQIKVVQIFYDFYQGPLPKQFEGKIKPGPQFDQAA